MMEAKEEKEKVVSLFPKEKANGTGGGNGGDEMAELIKRVEQLEKDTNQIRVDMAKLTTRSETFATKEDIQLIRTDMHKEISSQTKWLAATIIGIAGISLAIAKYLFG